MIAFKAYNLLRARLWKVYNTNLNAISTARDKVKNIDRFKSVSLEE